MIQWQIGNNNVIRTRLKCCMVVYFYGTYVRYVYIEKKRVISINIILIDYKILTLSEAEQSKKNIENFIPMLFISTQYYMNIDETFFFVTRKECCNLMRKKSQTLMSSYNGLRS